jgi:DNA processing protein
MIQTIEEEGLVLSQFESGIFSNRYNFPIRNELTVALGEILIVSYADLNSGTLTSVKFAQQQGKEIYVFPHRLQESLGTQQLLQNDQVKCIYDLDDFLNQFGQKTSPEDELVSFCQNHPTYEEVLQRFGAQLFEYELQGKIAVKNGKVSPT